MGKLLLFPRPLTGGSSRRTQTSSDPAPAFEARTAVVVKRLKGLSDRIPLDTDGAL